MIRSFFASACLAGASLLSGCNSEPSAPDADAQKRFSELSKISSFIDDNYKLGAENITISGMTPEQRTLTLRFIALNDRTDNALAAYNKIMDSLRYVVPLGEENENGMGLVFNEKEAKRDTGKPSEIDSDVREKEAPRATRHDYLITAGKLNTMTDHLLNQVRNIVETQAPYMRPEHMEALNACASLRDQRKIKPAFPEAYMRSTYPEEFLKLSYPGEERRRSKEYGDMFIRNFDLKADFQANRFKMFRIIRVR